jgi:hypothetical protein
MMIHSMIPIPFFLLLLLLAVMAVDPPQLEDAVA